jgi:hypothetical protein
MANGDYSYVFTFVNEGGGETVPSPVVDITVSGANDTVTLSNIPDGPTGISGPGLCNRRRIYRSLDGGAYQLLVQLDDADTTTGYVDTTLQADLLVDATMPLSTPDANTLTVHTAPLGNSTSLYDGVAPIGAHVSVETALPLGVWITLNVLPLSGYSVASGTGLTDLTALLNASLDAYFTSLEPGETIRYNAVVNAIHDTAGVDDYGSVLILVDGAAGVATNVVLTSGQACQYAPASSIFTEVSTGASL